MTYYLNKLKDYIGYYFGLPDLDKEIHEQLIIMEMSGRVDKFITDLNLYNDKTFIDTVVQDINNFLKAQSHNCLVFPCMRSRHRFIIHNLVAEVYKSKLRTFSVGLYLNRRIVICSAKLEVDKVNEGAKAMAASVVSDTGAISKRRARPAAPIYVPPAVRRNFPLASKPGENYNPPGTSNLARKNENVRENKSVNMNVPDNVIKTQVPEISNSSRQNLNTTSQVQVNENIDFNSLTLTQNHDEHTENDQEHKENDQEHQELFRASEEINRKKRIIKQSFNKSDVLIISEKNIQNEKKNDEKSKPIEDEPLVENWEDLTDEKLESDVVIKIIEQVGDVNITTTKEDYGEYVENRTLQADFGHVLELYGFPKQFETRDLVTILEGNINKSNTFHIKWVDPHHALAVFSSGFIANQMLLTLNHPLLKLRAMSDASEKSITKAIKYPNAMLPRAVRPQTCPQTARRLVTGALGLSLQNAREERAREIVILREARERRRLAMRQEEDAWLGNPRSSNE